MTRVMVVDATWEGEIVLGATVLAHLKKKKIKTLAVFASVQFLRLEKVFAQLKTAGIDVKTTKAKRTDVPVQILGCDAYEDSFQEDIISTTDATLYIGDGLFHPKALLLSQITKKVIKDVIIWDPVANAMSTITKEDVEKQAKRLKANMVRYLAADTIGVLVSIKTGQQYLNQAKKLKVDLEAKGKRCYIFIDDVVNLQLLENYPFIKAWVNTACPRIGFDDLTTIAQPLINIRDAIEPEKTLSKLIL